MHNFYVGQKVVCVDAIGCLLDGLTEGVVYTIRDIYGQDGCVRGPTRGRHIESTICLLLKEIYRGDQSGGELGYRATRFRPLVQTDISIFQAMLSPTPVKQREGEDA